MSPHGMAHDRLAVQINRKFAPQQSRELFGDIVPHVKMRVPRLLCGVDIKASALPKVIGRVISNICAARGCVREDQSNSLLRRPSLRACFGHRVFMGAGQA